MKKLVNNDYCIHKIVEFTYNYPVFFLSLIIQIIYQSIITLYANNIGFDCDCNKNGLRVCGLVILMMTILIVLGNMKEIKNYLHKLL